MEERQGQWYIRKQGQTSGPFNASVITNHLLAGRLTLNDEVSADNQHWLRLAAQPHLHPDLDDEQTVRARRWMDERTGQDRRQQQQVTPPEASKRRGERRAQEPEIEQQRRALRQQLMQKYRQRHQRVFWPMLATFVLLLLLTILAVLYPTTLPVPLPNCSAPAAAQVNWNNCLKAESELANMDLTGAKLRNSQLLRSNFMNTTLVDADLAYSDLRLSNLSYSDLQGAILLGTNLTQADLSYANLSGADLSYADLTGANLGQTKLDNARLDHTIWITGQLCARGSVGECITSAE